MKKNIRILHIGSNIANNVFLNALFLREKGYIVDAISPDYDHPISTPEWEQANINPKKINQILKSQNIQNIDPVYKRPSWYLAGPLRQIAQNKFDFQDNFSAKLIQKEYSNQRLNRLISKINFIWIKFIRKINPYYEFITIREYLYYQSLVKKFKDLWPKRKDQLTIKDIIPYISHVRIFKHIFARYDLIQCYSTNAIVALLANKRPYIAFEHGTIRDLPFTNSPEGRLTALSYRLANLVFITNNDNILAAKKLGIKNFVAIPHPIDDFWFNKLSKTIKKKNKKKIIFCPSRHDWQIKGLDLFIKAISETAKNTKIPFEVVFIRWGKEWRKSQKLIKKLNISQYVHWEYLLTKRQLIQKMLEADIILDQTILSCMGAISPEGLRAGKPVLLSYNHNINKWAYPTPPPLIKIHSVTDASNALIDLLNHPRRIKIIGQKSILWFNKYHSKKVICKIEIQAYNQLLCSKKR